LEVTLSHWKYAYAPIEEVRSTAKMLWSVIKSPDGFIAGRGGDMSWLTEHLGPTPQSTS